MENYQAVAERLSQIKRFIVPVKSDDPIPGRPQRFGLNAHDFGLVREGRACARCLACWEDRPLAVCPACGHERSWNDILDGIKEWSDHDKEWERALENPQRTTMPSMDQVIDATADEVLEGWRPNVKRNL